MAVEATQGDGVFEPSGSILGNLFRDWGRALTLRPIEMETVRESIIPIIIYTAFLSIEIFLGMWLASLVKGTGVEQGMNARLSLGAFCTMLLFFFILGYIYKVALKRMLDASYLSYVYVVALSMTYYPILLFLSRITDKYIVGILLMIASAVISQLFHSSSSARRCRGDILLIPTERRLYWVFLHFFSSLDLFLEPSVYSRSLLP